MMMILFFKYSKICKKWIFNEKEGTKTLGPTCIIELRVAEFCPQLNVFLKVTRRFGTLYLYYSLFQMLFIICPRFVYCERFKNI